jgi:hypothetical protein
VVARPALHRLTTQAGSVGRSLGVHLSRLDSQRANNQPSTTMTAAPYPKLDNGRFDIDQVEADSVGFASTSILWKSFASSTSLLLSSSLLITRPAPPVR